MFGQTWDQPLVFQLGVHFVASVERLSESAYFHIRFRYGGKHYQRSLKTDMEEDAFAARVRVEETIRLLDRGRLEIPTNADPATFILSDGKSNGQKPQREVRTLGELFRAFQNGRVPGGKEEETRKGEDRHIRHMKRHLGVSRIAQSLIVGDMQRYVNLRSKDFWRGKQIGPETIDKEIRTFRLIWNWGVRQGFLIGAAPIKGIEYRKLDEKLPFMTWAEIERIIARGGLTDEDEERLWESLFLTTSEIEEFLADARKSVCPAFVYPMLVFVAHTGARRSEIVRSRVEDFDFHTGVVKMREKKKSRRKNLTFRRVPMSEVLERTMSDWFDRHPGGQSTLCIRAGEALSRHQASYYFDEYTKGTKWEVVRGFHVFRHSFASNLAAGGLDQRMIDEWMGHQTEEMRKRYRHLFPDQQRDAINSVFGRNGK